MLEFGIDVTLFTILDNCLTPTLSVCEAPCAKTTVNVVLDGANP